MLTYPLVYFLIWAIPTSIRIYQAVTSDPAPFGIATVDKVCSAWPLFLKIIARAHPLSLQSDSPT